MRINRSRAFGSLVFGIVMLAATAEQTSLAAERLAGVQPVLIPGGHYTRLLGAAPLKPPVLFANDDEAIAARMETVGWYRYGAPGFGVPGYGYYGGGFGGLYGPPFYGYRGYPYWGGGYGGWAGGYGGWAGGYGGPFGYYGVPFGFGYSTIGYGYPYGVGFRPWGAYPYFAPVFNAPYLIGAAAFAPYGNFGGGCYW